MSQAHISDKILFPECIKEKLSTIVQVLKVDSPEAFPLNFRVSSVHDGSRLFYKHGEDLVD